MKNEKAILYGIIGFLAGIVITILVASNAVNNNMTGMMQMMGIRTDGEKTKMMKEENVETGHGMDSSMDEMTESLKGKTGDEFDETFLSAMIVHHQGAIDMAELGQQYSGHDEIKNLANDIIVAQINEIKMMRQWQKDWRY